MLERIAANGPLAQWQDSLRREPLSQREYEDIEAHVARTQPYRYLLFTRLLRGTGLRIAEALRVEPRFIGHHGAERFLIVTRGKQPKNRAPQMERVFLSPQLGADLVAYVEGQKLAVGMRVFPFTARSFERHFKAAALEAIGRPAHPHQMRALYGKWLLDQGVPVEAVAKLLGHKDHRVTLEHYYDLTVDQRVAIAARLP